MKTFLLAAVTAAGLLLSTSSADAQWRNRRGSMSSYSYPTYSYSNPTYSYGYSYPTYSGSEVVTSSYYTPTYTYPSGNVITSGGTYYTSPSYSYPSYNNGYYNNSYYNNGYYNSGYGSYYTPGLNINSSGGYWNGRRIWR